MNSSLWIRQSQRWLSIVFTLTVIANFVFRAEARGEPPSWLTYSPLAPLFLLLFTYICSRSLIPPSGAARRASNSAVRREKRLVVVFLSSALRASVLLTLMLILQERPLLI